MTTTPEAVGILEAAEAIAKGEIPWNAVAAEIGPHTICHAGKPLIFGGAKIGDYCKIQNLSIIGPGVTVEDGVYIGPCVTFTNDLVPRAINPDGTLKEGTDWHCEATLVKYGASIGAGATVCPGVTIGRWAMVCAGSVVVRDVPDYGKVFGNPAKLIGWVDETGANVKDRPNACGHRFVDLNGCVAETVLCTAHPTAGDRKYAACSEITAQGKCPNVVQCSLTPAGK